MKKVPAIGIDFGTTYSCVSVWQNGKAEIIPNDQGNRTTPSYVAFTDTERLIGEAAKNRMVLNPDNIIFNTKRLLGRKYNDANLQEDSKHWPFKLLKDCGKAKIEVEYKGETKQLFPEEISAMVLVKMKETAEAFLKIPITDAVISVPAYFNNSQRQAVLDAGIIAGLNVLKLVNEPTAAAMAYVIDKNIDEERNILVFDLGGGTFDVSVITVYEGMKFDVHCTLGNTYLGGEDLDNKLLIFLLDEFKRTCGEDLSGNVRALHRIKMAVETAKYTLSSGMEACIEIEALYLGFGLYTKITRARFEEMCADLFCITIEMVEIALNNANMDRNMIDDIVLVGGSTRLHKIQSLLYNFFGRPVSLSINADEAVACGAAIQAAVLAGDTSAVLQTLKVRDVTSQSLGFETVGGFMTNVIQSNTKIPFQKMLIFSTYRNNQSAITVQVFEGPYPLVKDNNLLGTFVAKGIPPMFRGTSQIQVCFCVDSNGIFGLFAEEISTERTISLSISSDRVQYDIDQMIADNEKFRQEDAKQKELVAVRNKLERYVFGFKEALSEAADKFSLKDKTTIENKCESCLRWLDNNLLAEKDEYEDWFEQLTSLQNSIKAKVISASSSNQSLVHSCGQFARDLSGDPAVIEID